MSNFRRFRSVRFVFALALFAAAGSLAPRLEAQNAPSDAERRVHAGRALAYRQLDSASLEHLTTPERIFAVAEGGFAPTEIWRALEHGEKVECLRCIPGVSRLLFASDGRTREISAWWLRRRVLGVFGPGQVYERMVQTLGSADEPEHRRAYAAEALGEFLLSAGVPHVSRAVSEDSSPLVRRSAVRALQRLNSAGAQGELALAIGDEDEGVRLAAIEASTRVNVFSGVDALATRIDDPSSSVRVAAIEALGALRARDAVVALITRLSPSSEGAASVRAAAAAALGEIGDRQARDALSTAASDDPDRFVRDAARIALRRL